MPKMNRMGGSGGSTVAPGSTHF